MPTITAVSIQLEPDYILFITFVDYVYMVDKLVFVVNKRNYSIKYTDFNHSPIGVACPYCLL